MKILRVTRALFWSAGLAAAGFASAAPAPAPAPAPAGAPSADDLMQAFNSASAAFAAGDYAAAVAGLEKVVAQAPPDSKLEAVYFTLGAAYFNSGQYAKAVDTLKTYRARYPNGARAAEAAFSLGQACLLTHDNPGALEAFKAVENNAAYREQALLYEATALKDASHADEAIATLDKLVAPGIRDSVTANGALLLADLYGHQGQPDKALAIIGFVRQHAGLLDDPARLNSVCIEIGDALLQQRQARQALACYRAVQSRGQILKLQNERIATLQDEIARLPAAVRADPAHAANTLAAGARVKAALAEATQRLADFQKLPDFESGLLARLATCFVQMNQPWEAVVAYDEILRRDPNDPAVDEPALYGLITSSVEAGRGARARELCERYRKEYAQGPNADTVGYLLGASALQENDPKGVETYFGQMLGSGTPSAYAEQMRFLLGNAQFSLGEYDRADATYAKYRADYPKGQNFEEATYRSALSLVFAGAYEKAIGALNDYVKAFPNGDFVPDARYRLAVCQFAASQYDVVIAACQDWEKQYPHGPLLGEVLALQADALASRNQNTDAVDTYLRSYKAASSDEVADYSIFAAQKLLQKGGDWARMADMFKDFLRDHPERPSAVMAVYWIGKAESHEGKSEEAKHFVADTIKQYVGDSHREAVEQLLTQLATLCVRKPPAAGAAPAGPDASPAPAPAAPAADPGAEMDQLLGGAETDASPLARARVLFAKSELARLRRQTPVQEQDLQAIATGFKPEELSAPLLATVGDYLLGKERFDQAAPVFERLLAAYPKSTFLEFAYSGLGEIAFQARDYPRALQLFTDAVDKAAATAKLKDVTVGKARTLLALGRLDEAKALFEQVASTREWRGESTALAVYSLGEIMRKQNKLPEAIAFYQRVFVAYQRYLPWVAKSYVASAECFVQLGKNQEAINTYREMVKNPKLQDFGETQTARDFLQKNGQG